jgi:hypothetical protein
VSTPHPSALTARFLLSKSTAGAREEILRAQDFFPAGQSFAVLAQESSPLLNYLSTGTSRAALPVRFASLFGTLVEAQDRSSTLGGRTMASIIVAVLVVLVLLEWQITKLTQRVRQVEVDVGAKPGYLTRGQWLSKFRAAAEEAAAEESSKRAS